MHAYVRRGLYGTLTAGGLLLLGAVGASADTTTTGSHGVASGTQVIAPVAAPVTAQGNAVSVLGRSAATHSGSRAATGTSHSAPAGSTAGSGARTSGRHGVASGTQVLAPVAAPASVADNAVSVLGRSSVVKSQSNGAPSRTSSDAPARGAATSGTRGIGSGTQVNAPVTAPVTVSGNSIALLGSSSSTGSSRSAGAASTSGSQPAAGNATTSGERGAASGTQVLVPVTAPVTVDGNAVSVLGRSSSGETGGTPASGETPAGATSGGSTSGGAGLGSGTQVYAPVAAPVTVDGNALSVLGQSTAAGSVGSASSGDEGSGGVGSAPEDTSGHTTGDTSGGMPSDAGSGVGSSGRTPSGEGADGIGGFGADMLVDLPVTGQVTADGDTFPAAGCSSSGAHLVVSSGSGSAVTSPGTFAGGVGAGSPSTEGVPGSNDTCSAKIALMSGAAPNVSTAGVAGGNVASTGLSAAMLLLLGAAMGSTLRRKKNIAGASA